VTASNDVKDGGGKCCRIKNDVEFITKKVDNTYTAWFMLPGFKKTDVSVSVDGDIINIKSNESVKSNELLFSFDKKYNKPDGADLSKLHAKMEDGILTVVIPLDGKVNRNVTVL
jgi:HSP20 family molecular chaperone IbpA